MKRSCMADPTMPGTVDESTAPPSPLFSHSHCPDGCDHPQSFVGGDVDAYGNEYCECCWFRLGVVTMLVPCTAEHCGPGEENRTQG